MAIEKVLLSGSTGGRPILVADDNSPGTLIHETGTSSSVLDEIWLYAHNTHSLAVEVTVEWGDDGASDRITLTLAPQSGLVLVAPGLLLVGTGAAAREVRAYAELENLVTLTGYVNRISP